jgi:hypothetical protein
MSVVKGTYFTVALVLGLLLWSVLALAAQTLASDPPTRGPAAIVSGLLVAEVAGVTWLAYRHRHQPVELINVTSAALWIVNVLNLTGMVVWHPGL